MGTAVRELDPAKIRADFPILSRTLRAGKPLVYLDSAATSQKPEVVLDALSRHYRESNANIHRGVHQLGEAATEAYEGARKRTANFLRAGSEREVVFTHNATEALNLVARGWGERHVAPGDEILVTEMEHHSNLVPWLRVASSRGAAVKAIPVLSDGSLDLFSLESLLTSRTKVVAVTASSNVLGTLNPVRRIADAAHAVGAICVVDGAQSAPHAPTDVAALGADFFAFSAHKMLGPMGVGILWGKPERFEETDPLVSGGGMIHQVFLDRWTMAQVPMRFEAGTPDVAGCAAFVAALDYLDGVGLEAVGAHSAVLAASAARRLRALSGVTVYGPPAGAERGSLVSFNLDGLHPHDVGQFLDAEGVAVRVGHHCCQPLMRRLDVAGTVRASFYLYNTEADVAALLAAVEKTRTALS